MDPAKDGHKTQLVPCPVCETTFHQRIDDQRPKTCSRSCARKLEWETRERKERSPGPNGYWWHIVPNEHPYGHVLSRVEGGTKYILEHRWAMEEALGRYLEPHERVHHKNGNRADNRVKKGHATKGCPPSCCNLELWRVKTKDPPGVRASDYHCPGCRCDEAAGTVRATT